MVKEYIIFGAAKLKALPPNILNLIFGPVNNSAEDDLREHEGVYN